MFDPHQYTMLEFVSRVKKSALFAELGSGKTASVLTAFVDAHDRFDTVRMLVVAPLAVARMVWRDEIAAWAHTRHLRFIHLEGSASKIARTIQMHANDYDVWTVSCDKVHILAKIFLGRAHPFDWLVIDESSRFKNQATKRSKSMRLISMFPERVTLMTGTPHPNGLRDLWMQIYMLDRGERLGREMKAYNERFFESASGTLVKHPTKASQKIIQNLIADISYVLRADEFDSVKPRYNYIKLDLTAQLKRDYIKFEKDYVLSLADQTKITAASAVGLGIKLLQFTSGAIYNEDRIAKPIHNIKMEALQDIVEDNPEKPVVVAYGFIHEAARIKKVFPDAELFDSKDDDQKRRWDAGKILMLLVHPRSAGHGINLQYGSHILVWFSFSYNLEEYQQTNKRLARKGQKNEVHIHHLIIRGSVDEIIIAALKQKDGAQESFQRALKRRIIELIRAANDATFQRQAA